MNFIEIIKAIPAIIGLVKSIISLVKHMAEKRHDDAVGDLDKAKTKKEAKKALENVAKNP